jgi:hypothetical protein
MGNCPSEFAASPVGFGSCIVPCPAQKNYELRVGDKGVLSCAYTGDPSISVPVLPVPAVQKPGPPFSYKELPNAVIYENEIKRFSDAIAVTDANIDKQVKINAAFKKLQESENARDTAPDAYQSARVAYYTLIKGDTWINEEKNRVANSEAQPVINNILDKYRNLQYTRSRQQAVIDSMNNVKQSVLGVKDDLDFSVSNFQKHIEDIKNQINKDKREQDIQLAKATTWTEVLLNWLIGLSTLMAIYFLVRYLMRPRPGEPPSDSDIMSYLRRSAYGSKSTTPTTR